MKLNKQGYEQYLKELENKKRELAEIRKYKGEVAIHQGDNWHDNPILYQSELKEKALMTEIKKMKEELEKIEIVDNLSDKNLVDIGDIVKVDMITDDDINEIIFKLVALAPECDSDSEITSVTIDSPIGNAMYRHRIGETVTYEVRDNLFELKLKEKMNLNEEDKPKKLIKDDNN